MQERTRECEDSHFIANPLDIQARQRFHRRSRLAFRRAKRCEIMLADEPLRRFVHRRGIEPPFDVPRLPLIKSQLRAAIIDAINIMPTGGGKARVEYIIHCRYIENGD